MSKDTNNIGKTVNLSGMFCGFESRLFAQICLGLGLGSRFSVLVLGVDFWHRLFGRDKRNVTRILLRNSTTKTSVFRVGN